MLDAKKRFLSALEITIYLEPFGLARYKLRDKILTELKHYLHFLHNPNGQASVNEAA